MMQQRTAVIVSIRQKGNPWDYFCLLPERIYTQNSNSRNQEDFMLEVGNEI